MKIKGWWLNTENGISKCFYSCQDYETFIYRTHSHSHSSSFSHKTFLSTSNKSQTFVFLNNGFILSQAKIHNQEQTHAIPRLQLSKWADGETENNHGKQTHNKRSNLSTYRFLDFFFFVPSGPTSQLQGDPELSWGEMKESTHCIIHPPHRKRAL